MILSENKLKLAIKEAVEEAIEKDSGEDYVDDCCEEEIERRQWCIDKATYLDDITTPEKVIQAADKFYEYVWGKKSE